MFLAVAASAGRADLPAFLGSLSIGAPRDAVRFQLLSFLQTKFGALGWQADVVMMGALTTQPRWACTARRARSWTRRGCRSTPSGRGCRSNTPGGGTPATAPALRRLARRFTLLSVGLATLIFGMLTLFHQPVIRMVLGPDFAGAAGPLRILIPGAFAFLCIAALHVLPAATAASYRP